MEYPANHIDLCGALAAMPAFSHENHGRKFYRFILEVERLSGTADLLPIMASEEVLCGMDLSQGYQIEVSGQIRSFNSKSGVGRKLIISVYAETLQTSDREPRNEARLIGSICKEPVYRRTPLGREICDVMLAVNRLYHRSDYIPCILWGRSAQDVCDLPVGSRLEICGRLQSRDYVKILPDGEEKRTAYEVSAISAEVPEQTDDAE